MQVDIDTDTVKIQNISITTRITHTFWYRDLHFYNFFISRVLYKRSQEVYNLLRFTFFPLSIILWRFIQVVAWISDSSFLQLLWLSSILWHVCSTVCLTTNKLTGTWVAFKSWIWQIKLLQTFVYKVLCEHNLYSSGKMPKSATAGSYHSWRSSCFFFYS